jgi:hypothetical protein
MILLYSFISGFIMYYILFIMPKQGKKKPVEIKQPIVSNIILDHVKNYDEELIKIAEAAQAIKSNHDCAIVINAIECFRKKYTELYGKYLVQIDVSMLCELAEKKLKKINPSLRIQVPV